MTLIYVKPPRWSNSQRVYLVWEVSSSNLAPAKLDIERSKYFATVSTSTQVAVLTIGTLSQRWIPQTHFTLWSNMATSLFYAQFIPDRKFHRFAYAIKNTSSVLYFPWPILMILLGSILFLFSELICTIKSFFHAVFPVSRLNLFSMLLDAET